MTYWAPCLLLQATIGCILLLVFDFLAVDLPLAATVVALWALAVPLGYGCPAGVTATALAVAGALLGLFATAVGVAAIDRDMNLSALPVALLAACVIEGLLCIGALSGGGLRVMLAENRAVHAPSGAQPRSGGSQ